MCRPGDLTTPLDAFVAGDPEHLGPEERRCLGVDDGGRLGPEEPGCHEPDVAVLVLGRGAHLVGESASSRTTAGRSETERVLQKTYAGTLRPLEHGMSGRTVVLAAALVLAATLAALSAGGLASPQDRPACPLCPVPGSDDTELAAVEIVFTEVGHADWRITAEITDEGTADEWREEPPERSLSGDGEPVSDPHEEPAVTVTDDDELVVEFRDLEAARPAAGGTLLVDYFHSPGDGADYLLNARELTVHAPEGYVVANDPAGAEVHGSAGADGDRDRATWESEGYATLDDPLVVFAPEDAVAPGPRATVATAGAVVPVVAGNWPFVAVPTALFAVPLVGFAVGTRLVAPHVDLDGQDAALGCAVLATLAVLAVVWTHSTVLSVEVGLTWWLVLAALPLLGAVLVSGSRLRSALAVTGTVGLFALAAADLLAVTGYVHPLAVLLFPELLAVLGVSAVPLLATGALAERWRRERTGGAGHGVEGPTGD